VVNISFGGKGKGTYLVETGTSGKGKCTILVETVYWWKRERYNFGGSVLRPVIHFKVVLNGSGLGFKA